MRTLLALFLAAICSNAVAESDPRVTDDELAAQMERAWEVTWSRFYLPGVQTFADYLSSYVAGKEQAHLPTAEEVKRQYPNPCGYSTGMEDGAILGGAMPAYALLQMQASLEVLHELEPDPVLKATMKERMKHVRDLAARRFTGVRASLAKKSVEEMRMTGPDWRHVPEWTDQKGYPNPQWGPFREIWHLTREAGESSLILLMIDPADVAGEQESALRQLLGRFDYAHNASCGIIYHLAAYWKARRHGLLADLAG